MKAIGFKAEHADFGGGELNGLPDGVVHDVGEFARGEFGPVAPVSRTPEGVMGDDTIALWRQIAEG